MTITIDGVPQILKLISTNHFVELLTRADTKVTKGYWLENFFTRNTSCYDHEYKFHKKCRIYVCETHGYYVKPDGIRCYMNSLMTDEQMEEIGFYKNKI